MSPDPFDRLDPKMRERLSAWLDGEATPEEAREVLSWLESDPAAAREVEELRRVWDLLGRYRDEPVPEGFADSVLARTSGAASAVTSAAAATSAVAAPRGVFPARRLALAASIGLTTLVFQGFLGHDELTYFVPFAVAVLLLSLGSDYNVFVVGRIWQTAEEMPLRDAIATAAALARKMPRQSMAAVNRAANSGSVIAACQSSIMRWRPPQRIGWPVRRTSYRSRAPRRSLSEA